MVDQEIFQNKALLHQANEMKIALEEKRSSNVLLSHKKGEAMKKILVSILSIVVLLLVGNRALAEEKSTGAYSVVPEYSEHQTASVQGFFDIRWTPSATDEFGIAIANKSDKETTYDLQVNKAVTNRNGVIDYSNTTPEADTIQYPLTKLVQLPKEVTVAPNSTQVVKGKLTFPEASYNGILMAGIHVSEKQSQDKTAAVSNTVAYNIPFVVRGDNDSRPQAILTCQSVSVKQPTVIESTLDIALTNEAPTFLKESSFKAEIKDANGQTVKTKDSKLDVTPQTAFTYPIKLSSDMKAGDYTVDLTVTHAKDKWHFAKKFTLTGKQAKVIRSQNKKQGIAWYVYVLIGVLVLFIVWIAVRLKNKLKGK